MSLTRRDKILKLIVEDFIKTARPVGSHNLIENYNLNVSSATVRNEMNALEKDGYLEKTHTSSGRVPSTKGYRYYVEHLKNPEIDEKIKHEINNVFDSAGSIEEILKESCEILSNMTNLASVVLGPSADEEKLVSIQLVPLNNTNVTAIFVTDKGYVENKTFTINNRIKMSDVETCVKILNDRLKGTQVNNLVEKLESIKPILSDYIVDYTYLYNAILKTFNDFAQNRNNDFYGTENLISQPEFRDNAESLKQIFGLFNNPEDLERILDEASGTILLNCGEIEGNYEDVNVISKEIVANGSTFGRIAIIGPTRMDYGNVVNSLNYIVTKIIEKLNYEKIEDDKEES